MSSLRDDKQIRIRWSTVRRPTTVYRRKKISGAFAAQLDGSWGEYFRPFTIHWYQHAEAAAVAFPSLFCWGVSVSRPLAVHVNSQSLTKLLGPSFT